MTVLEAVPPTTPLEQRQLMGDAYDLAGASSADEARTLAGLNWEPVHRPLAAYPVDIEPADVSLEDLDLVEKERCVRRSDTGAMLGVVGREHKLLTNTEMFDFADTLLSAADTTWADSEPFGGALADGKSPFLAFKIGEGVEIAGEDAVDNHVLLTNGHVGNTAFILSVLPLRYRCSNVVTAAIRSGRKGENLAHYSIQHSGDIAEKMTQVREALDMTSAYMREFEDMANRMAATEMDRAAFEDFLTDLVPLSPEAGDRAKKTVEDRRAAFRANWSTPSLTDDLRTTTWGALNVVTEVIDHGSLDVRRSSIPAPERRMRFVHNGAGADLRNRAYSLLGGVR